MKIQYIPALMRKMHFVLN